MHLSKTASNTPDGCWQVTGGRARIWIPDFKIPINMFSYIISVYSHDIYQRNDAMAWFFPLWTWWEVYTRSAAFPCVFPFFFLLIQATVCFNMLSDSAGYVNSPLVPWPHAWWRLTVFDTVEWHLTHSDNVSYLLLGTKPRQKWQPHSFQWQQRRLLLQPLPQVVLFQGNTERDTVY